MKRFSLFDFLWVFFSTACAVGWYGPECKLQCSGHCADNTVCNHVDGSCVGDCAAGWYGSHCNTGKYIKLIDVLDSVQRRIGNMSAI